MPWRVGITTNLEARKAAWQSKVVGMKNWRKLKTFSSRKEAQEYETWYANKYKCQASPGGASARGPWHVYRFDYTRTK